MVVEHVRALNKFLLAISDTTRAEGVESISEEENSGIAGDEGGRKTKPRMMRKLFLRILGCLELFSVVGKNASHTNRT